MQSNDEIWKFTGKLFESKKDAACRKWMEWFIIRAFIGTVALYLLTGLSETYSIQWMHDLILPVLIIVCVVIGVIARKRYLSDVECYNVTLFDSNMGYDYCTAFIGVTPGGVAVYDYDKMLDHIVQTDKELTYEDAIDWVDSQTLRALPYAYEKQPHIVYTMDGLTPQEIVDEGMAEESSLIPNHDDAIIGYDYQSSLVYDFDKVPESDVPENSTAVLVHLAPVN